MNKNFGLIIMGVIGIIVAIVLAAVATAQLDTAMTAEAALTNTMAGLGEIMGVYGILFWVVITGAGLAMLGFGTFGAIREARRGGKRRKKVRRGAQ